MKKTILYRLFGLGAIPGKLLPILEQENIVVFDEGIGGWFITKSVKGPGKRYLHRSEGFSGFLAVTRKRVVCFTNWKRQINISVEDPKISHLYVHVPADEVLSISFESSAFREGWEWIIEFRFKTEKAIQFNDVLGSVGAQQGAAPDGN
jgi:hypothetical protein